MNDLAINHTRLLIDLCSLGEHREALARHVSEFDIGQRGVALSDGHRRLDGRHVVPFKPSTDANAHHLCQAVRLPAQAFERALLLAVREIE